LPDRITAIDTHEDAVLLLRRLLDRTVADEELPEDVQFGGEVASLLIEVEGQNYHASLTGSLSRGLWEMQQEVYRAVALTLHGSPSIKRLTKEELQDYNLVIGVEDGCTRFIADIRDIVGHLKDGVNSMESRHRLILYISIVVILAAGIGLTKLKSDDIGLRGAERLADIEAKKSIELAKIQLEQLEIVRKAAQQVPAVERWLEASEQSAKAIAKSVIDAESVSIGRERLDKQEIAEINQRSSREVPDVFIMTGYFRVTSTTEPTADGIVRVGLAGSGEEFIAYLNLADEAHPISDEDSNAIFLAPKHGTRIYMSLKVKRASDGIREAFVLAVPKDPDALV